MNAGRDVERLITGWLVEESPRRAPDRILGQAADVIERTSQRRASRVPWRRQTMSQTYRLLAGAAALAAVVAGGVFFLKPGSGPSVGGPPSATPGMSAQPSASAAAVAAPSPTARPAACALLSDAEAAVAAEFPDVGARAVADGNRCMYLNSLNPIFDITTVKPGGQAAFQAARNVSGVQPVDGIASGGAIWDPATGVLTMAVGDVMVTIDTRTPAAAPGAVLVQIAKVVAARM